MLIKTKIVDINNQLSVGGDSPFFLIAGPCVIESEEHILKMAEQIKEITDKLSIPYIFKSSYDKANRSSVSSYRGPGMESGLKLLEKVKKEMDVPVISDVHSIEQVKPAAEVLDIIQVPAFLSRQTDLLIAVGETGKVVNVKKGQFLSPWDTENIILKIESTGNKKIILTERGASFGYNHLIVDMKSFPVMRSFGYPVVYDVTHSVQLPGGKGTSSGGLGEFIEPLARAGMATGIDGIFMEVHDCPEDAMCDGPNSLPLSKLENLLVILKDIDNIVKK
ncbi:MAG: 3-deoxy-8-phosphooctulonate synthase [Acidobacteria bacterium]|nr:3-deoxy-8-phosphooctulonate synthase [Acidobacteriota bacterium]